MMATTNPNGGARQVLQQLAKLAAKDPDIEIHVGGHSAGSIFMAPLVQLLTAKGKITSGPLKGATGLGLTIASCTLWAPGITEEDFNATYLPVLQAGKIQRFALYTLTDEAERADNVGRIYNKSLLYLVANALEDVVGKDLIGLARDVDEYVALQDLFMSNPNYVWIQAPTEDGTPAVVASEAKSHGAFDDDPITVKSTLLRILGEEKSAATFRFARSSASLRNRRQQLDNLPR